MLAEVWSRLAGLLELHAEAEEEICYPAVFGPGPDAAAQMQDAIADHDDIREAIAEARLHAVGSPAWWRAAATAVRAGRDHVAQEERGVLAAFGRRAAPELRTELGLQWAAFTAARAGDAVPDHAHPRPSRRAGPGEVAQRYLLQGPSGGARPGQGDQAGDGPGHAEAGEPGGKRHRGHGRGQDQGTQRAHAVAEAAGEGETAGAGPSRVHAMTAGLRRPA